MKACDYLIQDVAVLDLNGQAQGGQSVAVCGSQIAWVGPSAELPAVFQTPTALIHGEGRLLTPGLIDCHTHLVFAGDRAHEFQLKLAGASYADIAKAGGGILSTVEKTRAASEESLLAQSLPRLQALAAEGVTTVEIKSGYGLRLEDEIKMLSVARQLGRLTGLRVVTTFLGAHALPPEFSQQQQAYVDSLCQEMLPEVARLQLADAVDVFCEHIAFNLKQTEQIFSTAQALGLPVKCHAEQLSNMAASQLAARYQALSCDHLEFLDARGAEALAAAGTVGVLLPGAFYFLREKKPPPVELLRQYRVPMAIATDCNPGSSPTASLKLMMSMACQLLGLSPAEAWCGVTAHAARALGLGQRVGQIAAGFEADLILWSVSDPAALCYYFGYPIPHQTMIAGQWVVS